MVAILWSSLILSGAYYLLLKRWRQEVEIPNITNRCLQAPWSFLTGAFCFFALVVLMSANRTGGDARSFEAMYSYVVTTGKDVSDYTYAAFFQLIRLFNRIFGAISFPVFHALILTISGCALLNAFKRYTYSFHVVFFIYLLSGTYASDGMQTKNFIAVCFLMIAYVFLLRDGIKSIVLYYLFAVIATIYHFSFFIYLILPIIKLPKYKTMKSLIPFIGIAMYMLMFVGGSLISAPIIRILSGISYLAKLGRYVDSFDRRRTIPIVCIYFGILLALYFCKKERNRLQSNARVFLDTTWDVWLLMGIFLPAMIYRGTAYRIIRNMYIPVFISLGNGLLSFPRLEKKRMLYGLMIIILCLLIYYYLVLAGFDVDIYLPVYHGEFFWAGSGSIG